MEGYGEAGVRFFAEKPSESQEAKFMEYRDINTGLYLDTLYLRFFTPDEKYSGEFSGRDWGLATQEYHLSGTRLGLWEGGFDWVGMRHLYSTNARILATETSDGVWTLPTPRPRLGAYNQLPFADEIGVQWNTAHMYFNYTPTPEIGLSAEYTRIRKDGDRPMGIAFGSPGNNFLEILQPIDQTIHDFRLTASWAKERWQLQFQYALSVFENDLRFMRADNPCASTTVPPAPAGSLAPCSGGDLGGPQFGTVSLPPPNMAHTLSLSGGINLPLRTRISGNFTYSLWTQNDQFLPQTFTNSLPASVPSVMLPQQSLNGLVQNFLLNLNVTSRPFPIPVTFTAKYRLYNMMDESDTPVFSAFLVNDANTITQNPTRASRFDFQRQNADLDARWQIIPSTALTIGVGWEQWLRSDTREVPETNTASAKAALDVTPLDWLMIRATYVPSFRRMEKYCTICLAGQENSAEPGEPGQSYLLRKFDEADLNQQLFNLMVQITPMENLTITPVASYKYNDYIASGLTHNSANRGPSEGNTMLGLQQLVGWSAGADLNWTPFQRVALTFGYVHESNFQKMRSRNRTSSVDVPDLDWISDITDTIETFHTSLNATLIPKKLDLRLAGSYAYALGTVNTRNPNATGSAIFNANPNAQAFPFPAYEDSLLHLEAQLRYHFAKIWSVSAYYIFEQFRKNNWQTDSLNPFIPGVSSIWLGNNAKNYEAQIIGMTLGFSFK